MKAYYQGLYTMGACSRDKRFPPALFGWVTTDKPTWNGDYHLNYNFYAPFYGLYSANRIEQATGQETPLLDFMQRTLVCGTSDSDARNPLSGRYRTTRS